MPAWFYILRLRSSGLYCGATEYIHDRVKDHFNGHGCRTTRIDPPVKLVHTEEFETYILAYRREQQIKRWSRAKKEALIVQNYEALRQLSTSKKKRNGKGS